MNWLKIFSAISFLALITGCGSHTMVSGSFESSVENAEEIRVYPAVVEYDKVKLWFGGDFSAEERKINDNINAQTVKMAKKILPGNVSYMPVLEDSSGFHERVEMIMELLEDGDNEELQEQADSLFRDFGNFQGLIVLSFLQHDSQTMVRRFLTAIKDIIFMVPTFGINMMIKENTDYHLVVLDASRKKVLFYEYLEDHLDLTDGTDLIYLSEAVWEEAK